MGEEGRGSCLCGRVQFLFEGPVQATAHCHCVSCRKASGAGHATWVLVAEPGFRWVSGESELRWFDSSDHGRRSFCGTCGAPMMNLNQRRPGVAHVAAGSIDEGPAITPRVHVYAKSRVLWVAIDAALPQFDELPPVPLPQFDELPPVRKA